MGRIDLGKTLEIVTFGPEVWEWLDFLGDAVEATQREAMAREDFLADTPFKQLLVRAIQRDLSSLTAIYILLRAELIHQAAAHVRLFCESVITLRYIVLDLPNRVPQFLNYAEVEGYELARAALKWEAERANPTHVKKMQELVSQLEGGYEHVKAQYVFTDRKGKQRPFLNWCNASLAKQASECGPRIRRIYEIVYSQLSAYVHGSAWSLRRQYSYSKAHYDAGVVLNDVATIVRTAMVTWEEWARLCDEQVGWSLRAVLPSIVGQLGHLDAKHFGTVS
jgi:hypothetical protein